MEQSETLFDDKATERDRLVRETNVLRALVASQGWKNLAEGFAEKAGEIEKIILSNASLLELEGKPLDGTHAIRVEAMQKGIARGIRAVINYPELMIVANTETLQLLAQVKEKKEATDERE